MPRKIPPPCWACSPSFPLAFQWGRGGRRLLRRGAPGLGPHNTGRSSPVGNRVRGFPRGLLPLFRKVPVGYCTRECGKNLHLLWGAGGVPSGGPAQERPIAWPTKTTTAESTVAATMNFQTALAQRSQGMFPLMARPAISTPEVGQNILVKPSPSW